MECNSWVEEGILYTSGELPADRSEALQKHLSNCKICFDEIETYKKEKSSWYTVDVLGVRPSQKLDARIKESCSKLPRPTTVISPVSLLFRKAVFSVLFLAVGFGGGVYFAINLDQQNADAMQMAEKKATPSKSPQKESGKNQDAHSAKNVAAGGKIDSAGTDSIKDQTVPYKRGNLKSEGVVPVDLKDE